jgi:hypothetical protein
MWKTNHPPRPAPLPAAAAPHQNPLAAALPALDAEAPRGGRARSRNDIDSSFVKLGEQLQGAGDLQVVRVEVANRLEMLTTRQEAHSREFDRQLNALAVEVQSQLKNIGYQQVLGKRQIDDLNERVQALASEDLIALHYQFDELASRFDRFMRVGLDAKMRPVRDEIRRYRAQVSEFNSAATVSARKLRETVNALRRKMDGSATEFSGSQGSVTAKSAKIGPTLAALEREVEGIKEALAQNSRDGASLAQTVASRFSDLQARAEKFRTDTVATQIESASATILGQLEDVCRFCDEECGKLQTKLDDISTHNVVIGRAREHEKERRAKLLEEIEKGKTDAKKFKEETIAQIEKLRTAFEADAAEIRAKVLPLEAPQRPKPKPIATQIAEINQRVIADCQALKREIAESTKLNEPAQQASLEKLAAGHKMHWQQALFVKLAAIENRLKWCIEQTNIIDPERAAVQKGVRFRSSLRRTRVKPRIAGSSCPTTSGNRSSSDLSRLPRRLSASGLRWPSLRRPRCFPKNRRPSTAATWSAGAPPP